ncbi:unnamed protein product [Anisakis simplex]|uniref:PDZ domain-containing protein 8 n=1 Tax=Anisakis simplex TaxID=6269 RepID=A0A0M3K5P4_ANISI|nr:unnamed protein product [Anisakis simplex]
MLVFLLGVLTGVFLVLLIAYVYLFSSLETFDKSASPFVDQFQPVRLAPVLRNFLKSSREDPNKPKWESCYILSLVLHFLYQEHNDTRRFRRWFHKRLQLELNDIVTRSTAGRLIQDIRIRDLSTGSQFPVLNGASCEGYRLSEDKEHFDWLSILLDIDYKGAFQASIDVSLLFGRYAQLSVKVAELSGKARLTLTREPYTHWTFAFVETPFLDFKVESQWQGKQLKHLIPLITQQFRRIIQRKHVFPNYKIRYRPFFNNPLLMPSPPIGAFDHIKLIGGLEVTVLQCTRLNTSLAALDHSEVYCTVCIEHRPFTHNTTSNSLQSTTLLVNFMRHGLMEPLGLSFINSANELGLRTVQINAIESGSAAERCGFLKGDTILAINNVPIQSDRQVSRLLCGSVSELNVLIERGINDSNCTSPQLNVDLLVIR